MNLDMRNISFLATRHDVKRAVADILHGPAFTAACLPHRIRPVNFEVTLALLPNTVRNKGTGILTLPDRQLGQQFLCFLRAQRHIKTVVVDNKEIYFSRSPTIPDDKLVQTLEKVSYQDPNVLEARDRIVQELIPQLCVRMLQLGVFLRNRDAPVFSPEWEQDYQDDGDARLGFDYEHNTLHLKVGDQSDRMRRSVVIGLMDIKFITTGREFGNPFLLFHLLTPPVFCSEFMHRPTSGRPWKDNKNVRQRLQYFDEAHKRVAPFAYQLRLVLKKDDDLIRFEKLCKTAGMRAPIRRSDTLEVQHHSIFSVLNLERAHSWIKKLDWAIAFQCEALLRNLRLNALELLELSSSIDSLTHHGVHYASQALRHFHTVLRTLRSRETVHEAFTRAVREFQQSLSSHGLYFPSTNFHAHHVIFTPTAIRLEGPHYTSQGNQILRDYIDNQDHFVRVDFRDENGLHFRWDREVDSAAFVRERFGKILHDGFEVAGRTFQFLAYSQSQLHEHSVFFMAPFKDPVKGLITASKIREGLGKFDNSVRRCPALFAARISQAFSGTEASVCLEAAQWEEMDDITVTHNGVQRTFTNGCGTISRELANVVWTKLCERRQRALLSSFTPVAFQIRFGGYKGVVCVDPREEGIKMRLRPSMRKFEVHDKGEKIALDIAHSFEYPGRAYLNRPLIQILEDLGVPKEVFLELQGAAALDIHTSGSSLSKFVDLLESHSLGRSFSLSYLFRFLDGIGCDFEHCDTSKTIATPFIRSIVETAMESALRGLKYSARIPIPESWNLVGVADESNVLNAGQIYACIWERGKGPRFLEGPVMISRSPTIHPGDVQMVHAIGKPPPGSMYEVEPLPNVVVFPCKGKRDLASCLAGGDLDGDLYVVSQYSGLLLDPKRCHPPGNYPPTEKQYIAEPSTIHDIADFVVEYFNSDAVGLLSDRHLILSDQSNLGVFDPACLHLAELCSKAVDYPKSGRPVSLKGIPPYLIPSKPDWKSGEVLEPRQTDYYESTRAIGYLFRAINLERSPQDSSPDSKMSTSKQVADNHRSSHLSSTFTAILEPIIQPHLQSAFDPNVITDIPALFSKYSTELKYICLNSPLSQTGAPLREAEVVVNTILAKSSQHRLRRNRIEQMQINTTELVNLVSAQLKGSTGNCASRQIASGWEAWRYSLSNPGFGAESFGLIALQVMLRALAEIGKSQQ